MSELVRFSKDYTLGQLEYKCEKQQQEISRLNNIINELEKCMADLLNNANSKDTDLYIYEQNKAIINMFLDKLKELKKEGIKL